VVGSVLCYTERGVRGGGGRVKWLWVRRGAVVGWWGGASMSATRWAWVGLGWSVRWGGVGCVGGGVRELIIHVLYVELSGGPPSLTR